MWHLRKANAMIARSLCTELHYHFRKDFYKPPRWMCTWVMLLDRALHFLLLLVRLTAAKTPSAGRLGAPCGPRESRARHRSILQCCFVSILNVNGNERQ